MVNSVSKDIEFETPSGWMLKITAEGMIRAAEPDVGIIGEWIDEVRLLWTSSGKEFSKSAYNRIPQCLNDRIDEQLYQAYSDSL